MFVLVGIAAGASWVRDRRPAAGWLAFAIGALALTAAAGQVEIYDAGAREVLNYVAIATFLFSGYALLEFRATFIPLRNTARAAALAVLAILFAAAVAAREGSPSTPAGVRAALAALLVLAWTACLADPIFRFIRASASVPGVQRGRLRSLATAFGALAVVLLADVLTPLAQSPAFQLAIAVVALLTIPPIYFSFAPPRWLRAAWRQGAEEELRQGMRDLLLFSPTRSVLAERAIQGAIRLVGADGGIVFDGEGTVLAKYGLDPERARALTARLDGDGSAALVPLTGERGRRTAVVLPLTLSSGTGALVVTSGPFTPYFGADEVERLRAYATSISAGLDRTVLTERLTALERTKTEFLNLASHELRGPVTLLRGYLSMIASGEFGELNPRLQQTIPIMEQRADEMNGLVDQMIEAARMEEGRLELHPVDVDLRELGRRAVDQIRPLADATHELVVEQPAEPLPALVDPDRIATILGNLLSNAIKYSPQGGRVRLRIQRRDGFGVISVSDEGVGIAGDQQARLFTRFGRLVNRETEHIGGTGLGLYLSRELARLHGGDVTVESQPGRGSTFSLTLPLASA